MLIVFASFFETYFIEVNGSRLSDVEDYSTEVDAKHKCFIKAPQPSYCRTDVVVSFSFSIF